MSEVDGVKLIDLRDDRELDHQQVETALSEALAKVRLAGDGYLALVTDHLRRVVALDSAIETASPFAESFNAGFRASDRRDSSLLAGKLVWAATYIRVMRDRPWWKRSRYSRQAHQAAEEMLGRFFERLGEGDRTGEVWQSPT